MTIRVHFAADNRIQKFMDFFSVRNIWTPFPFFLIWTPEIRSSSEITSFVKAVNLSMLTTLGFFWLDGGRFTSPALSLKLALTYHQNQTTVVCSEPRRISRGCSPVSNSSNPTFGKNYENSQKYSISLRKFSISCQVSSSNFFKFSRNFQKWWKFL